MALRHLDDGALDDLVFQRGNAERSSAARPPSGCTPVGRASLGTRPASAVSARSWSWPPGLAVLLPCHAIHSWRPLPASARSRPPGGVQGVDMVQQRGEPLLPIPFLLLAVPAPAPATRRPGSVSGARSAGASSPWPGRFPPLLRRPVAQLCSAASSVLRACPTSRARSSSACVSWTSRCGPPRHAADGRTRDLPVLARDVSVHARGLRPRGVRVALALATHRVWPSASGYSVGTPDATVFAAQYPACTSPCQRFTPSLRRLTHDSGPCGSLLLHRTTLSFATPHRFIPAHKE